MRRTFPRKFLAAIDKSKILGIRAGTGDHRFIGVWVVVVEGRVFIRSWTLKKDGWFQAFLKDPRGVISVDGRETSVRAVRTRSERLKDAVDRAYAAKYVTKASLKYVRGLARNRRRNTTTELVPRPRERGNAKNAASRHGHGR